LIEWIIHLAVSNSRWFQKIFPKYSPRPVTFCVLAGLLSSGQHHK
jgi:hypothetical protein